MLTQRVLLALTLSGTLLAHGVQAAPIEQPADAPSVGLTPITLRDPAMAAALSGGIPLALFALSPVTAAWSGVLAPLAIGTGQAYAGDPGRGALFSLGGYAVMAATTAGTMAVLGGARAPANQPLGQSIGDFITGGLIGILATTAFTGYAAWDAYTTVERANALALAPPPPPARYGERLTVTLVRPVVTEALRRALATGLSYEETSSRFGRPGAEIRFIREGTHTQATYRWTNPDASYVEAEFEDNRLMSAKGHALP